METIRMRIGLFACLVLLALAVTSCSSSTNEETLPRDDVGRSGIQVVTTFYPLYDFATKIGGDHVHVVNLIPAGIDPHDWTPKPKDIVKMTQADLFIFNGAGFESWMDSMEEHFSDETVVLDISEGIELLPIQSSILNEEAHEHGEAHKHGQNDEHQVESNDDHDYGNGHSQDPHQHGAYDPHFWTSPKRALQMAEMIADRLIEVDQANEQDYIANYTLLKERLEQLDQQLTEIVQQANRDHIVVTHHAFAYLAHDYGFQQVAIMGLSPDAEPTARQIQAIAEFIETEGVQYILFEQLVSPKLADTLAADLGIDTLVFNPLEGLTEEQMANGEDYFSVMEMNLQTLEKALR